MALLVIVSMNRAPHQCRNVDFWLSTASAIRALVACLPCCREPTGRKPLQRPRQPHQPPHRLTLPIYQPGIAAQLPYGRCGPISLPAASMLSAKIRVMNVFPQNAGAAQALAELFRHTDLATLAGRYNIAPSEQILAVRHRPDDPGYELVALRWGLVPASRALRRLSHPLTHARAETAAERPALPPCATPVPASGIAGEANRRLMLRLIRITCKHRGTANAGGCLGRGDRRRYTPDVTKLHSLRHARSEE
jgi:hypothetical protein